MASFGDSSVFFSFFILFMRDEFFPQIFNTSMDQLSCLIWSNHRCLLHSLVGFFSLFPDPISCQGQDIIDTSSSMSLQKHLERFCHHQPPYPKLHLSNSARPSSPDHVQHSKVPSLTRCKSSSHPLYYHSQ